MAAASYPSFFVTGAIHHYVQWVGISTPVYLGTCESNPVVAFQDLFTDAHNDTHGPQLPAQRVENGEMASLSMGLNRFSKQTMQALMAVVGPQRRDRFSRGRLHFGNTTLKLWQVFENALTGGPTRTTSGDYPLLEIGWYWPQVTLRGKTYPRMGNGKDQLLVLEGEALPYFTPQASVSAVASGEREFFLYSTIETGNYISGEDGLGWFPAGVRVPQ